MARVIVDSREHSADIIEGLEANGIDVTVQLLPVGDYAISDRVCIERKTVSDFESSLIDGRLFEQVGRLKKYYEFPILLIEGMEEFRLKRTAINGAIAHLYIEYGIASITSKDGRDSSNIIASLAKHEQRSGKREPSLKGGARIYTRNQFQEAVIGNLPGVGPKTAKALLAHFGTIKRIANASIGELMEVDMIGEKKASAISRVLNEKYEL
ncbi:MAG: ERCC4 domain-containing protein [Candidatus Micrarchaeaceae archaeon]